MNRSVTDDGDLQGDRDQVEGSLGRCRPKPEPGAARVARALHRDLCHGCGGDGSTGGGQTECTQLGKPTCMHSMARLRAFSLAGRVVHLACLPLLVAPDSGGCGVRVAGVGA